MGKMKHRLRELELLPSTSVWVNWVMAAVFDEIEEYNILDINRTETLFYWGYGIEVGIQMSVEDMRKIPDSVEVEGETV